MNRTRKITTVSLMLVLIMLLVAALQVGAVFAQGGDDPEPAEGSGGERQNPLCTDPDAKPHPVLASIAERYGVDYQQLVDWKCIDNYGVGEMLVALQTAGLVDDDAGALLGKKGKGNGWGKLWKEKGLVKSESDGGPPPWAQNNKNKDKDKDKSNNGNGPPDDQNPQGDDQNENGENGNNGNGPPAHANNDKDKPQNEKDDDDDDDAAALTCESGLVLDGDTVEDAEKLADKYDLPAFEIIAQLCGGVTLDEIEQALEDGTS